MNTPKVIGLAMLQQALGQVSSLLCFMSMVSRALASELTSSMATSGKVYAILMTLMVIPLTATNFLTKGPQRESAHDIW